MKTKEKIGAFRFIYKTSGCEVPSLNHLLITKHADTRVEAERMIAEEMKKFGSDAKAIFFKKI